jgi:hypothetical protein
MKRFTIIALLLTAVLFTFICCGDFDQPTGVGKDAGRTIIDPATQLITGGFPPLSDDFESGLDTGVWYLELVNGAQWMHKTEPGNGYIHAPSQYPYAVGNRTTDILTHEEGFDDFTLTWDMRFLNQGFHRDRRIIFFRTDNASTPHGYWIHMAVGYPYGPTHWLVVQKFNTDNTTEDLSLRIEPSFELNKWFSFKLEANANTFKLKIWVKGNPEPSFWAVEATDPASTFSNGRIGFGNYWACNTDVDNVCISPLTLEVYLDIKPGSCPNPFNTTPFDKGNIVESKPTKGGVLPAAILGCADFDVHDIDVTSLLLEGVQVSKSSYEDVAAPLLNGDECECTTDGPDEYTDLVLKFSKPEIYAALGPVSEGDIVVLTLTGTLLDGTDISGSDCVRIIANNLKPKEEDKIE